MGSPCGVRGPCIHWQTSIAVRISSLQTFDLRADLCFAVEADRTPSKLASEADTVAGGNRPETIEE